MRQTRISLVFLGNLKYPVNVPQLESWDSSLLKIQHGASIGHLPNSDGVQWQYTDAGLVKVVAADVNSDFTVGLINAPLEDNYYLRRLTDKIAILSLHEMADIARHSDFALEQYILRNLYEIVVIFAASGQVFPTDSASWAHDEIRGCLFDKNTNKSDIIFSLHQPKLCSSCRTRVSSKQVPADFLSVLESELLRIKKSLFFRMVSWVKLHPIFSLFITATTGVLLNLIASIIFEKVKRVLPWLS